MHCERKRGKEREKRERKRETMRYGNTDRERPRETE